MDRVRPHHPGFPEIDGDRWVDAESDTCVLGPEGGKGGDDTAPEPAEAGPSAARQAGGITPLLRP